MYIVYVYCICICMYPLCAFLLINISKFGDLVCSLFVQLQRHPETCFKCREQKSPTWGVQMRSHLIDKIPLPTQPEQRDAYVHMLYDLYVCI